ncbi:MAG TPA: Gfo/Idh/MocA family oxidoreductase [Cytophagales bacterium]|nr:Gfo/Idh/MocA family oxidoreductase [Cytophagales bacterium]
MNKLTAIVSSIIFRKTSLANRTNVQKHMRHKIIGSLISFLFLIVMFKINAQSKTDSPLRVVVIGISHGHAPWIFERKDKEDVVISGVYEPNIELVNQYAKRYNLNKNLFYTDLNQMLNNVKPEAAVAFGSIYEHMKAVEACAPRGIHVMVEKPLAVNMAHAKEMEQLAQKNNILLLTNYETSWYPSTMKTFHLVNDSNYVGKIRKVVIHDGHQGPKEIGVGKEFLDWLTDPVQNGGGALVDFGCYGANLMTYLMKGQQPISVTAVTRQFKPETYPKVEDEATIIVTYPTAQCIIQASWNWPFNRKDMEVYGETGYIIAENNKDMRLRNLKSGEEMEIQATADETGVYEDPFSYFSDAIRGKIKIPENGVYSLENNLMVVKILEAAKESAKTGKTVRLN